MSTLFHYKNKIFIVENKAKIGYNEIYCFNSNYISRRNLAQ